MFPFRDHNPSNRVAYVTYALIIMNVLVFLAGLALFQDDRALTGLYDDYAVIPARLAAGENYSALVTSAFLHGGFVHLAGNMLFLWIFGDNLEDKLGHLPFLLLYLICGIGAGFAQYACDTTNMVPMIGASGAVAGVMGAYLLLFPKARVDVFIFLVVFFRIMPVSAWLMLALWFGLQLFNAVFTQVGGGGVAYWAHVGGFVVGFVIILPVWFSLGGAGFWRKTEGHPDHPEAIYGRSSLPIVRKR